MGYEMDKLLQHSREIGGNQEEAFESELVMSRRGDATRLPSAVARAGPVWDRFLNTKEAADVLWLLVQKRITGTSLVAQWLRIRLPMQGTRVQALVREDPTCHRATKPVRHNY